MTKKQAALDSNLPEEILLEIFSRLPKRSLVRFRCVSKSQRGLFGTPSFENMHYELSNIRNGTRIVFLLAKDNKKYTFDYKAVSSLLPLSTSSETMCECEPWEYPPIHEHDEDIDKIDFLTSSYNGIVLVRCRTGSSCKEFYLWNMSTRWYKKLSMPQELNNDDDKECYGLGYNYKTNDCKLVRVVRNRVSKCCDVDVYTLGSDSWVRSQSIAYYLCYQREEGVLLNGAFHWLAHSLIRPAGSIELICFDIVKERFEEAAFLEVPMPFPEEPLERDTYNINVGELGGHLCLVYHVFNVRVDVWMMQEYGVRESWTKNFSIVQESITCDTSSELIWSFQNSETLWMVKQLGFVLYDSKKNRYKKLMLDSHINGRLIITHDDMNSGSVSHG